MGADWERISELIIIVFSELAQFCSSDVLHGAWLLAASVRNS